MTVQCCCCGQIKDEMGQWKEAEHRLDEAISHSYCDACFRIELDRIQAYRSFMRGGTAAA